MQQVSKRSKNKNKARKYAKKRVIEKESMNKREKVEKRHQQNDAKNGPKN